MTSPVTTDHPLIQALTEALARPNPPVSILGQPDSLCRQMATRGATHRIHRYGFGGAFVGYDYLDARGTFVAASMTACGNPV